MKTGILDLSGLKCPLPVLRTRKALRTMTPGETLTVISTDPMSAIDIPNLLRECGSILLATEKDRQTLTFTIRKAD